MSEVWWHHHLAKRHSATSSSGCLSSVGAANAGHEPDAGATYTSAGGSASTCPLGLAACTSSHHAAHSERRRSRTRSMGTDAPSPASAPDG